MPKATAPPVPKNGTSAPEEDSWSSGPITLRPLRLKTIEVPIVGTSPLIPHKWSEKSLGMMRDKQFGKAVRGVREPKNPEEEAEAATYRIPDGRAGMPSSAFKAAIVDACKLFGRELPMTLAKLAFDVDGIGPERLVPIEGDSYIREDTPRNSGGVVDLRYRRCFWPWSATLRLSIVRHLIDLDSMVALINGAGRCGVGDWRPSAPKSKTGVFGCFAIDTEKEIEVIS